MKSKHISYFALFILVCLIGCGDNSPTASTASVTGKTYRDTVLFSCSAQGGATISDYKTYVFGSDGFVIEDHPCFSEAESHAYSQIDSVVTIDVDTKFTVVSGGASLIGQDGHTLKLN